MPDTRTVEVDVTPANTAQREARRILARATPLNPDKPHEHAYLEARVAPVHTYGCPATAHSYKREGPCSCGAHALFNAWLNDAAGSLMPEALDDADAAVATSAEPRFCPYCGSGGDTLTYITDWPAHSGEDLENTTVLGEWQCHSAACDGRSFWA